METQSQLCPETKAPCTELPSVCIRKDNAQGKTFCAKWVAYQQAQGRQQLESGAKSTQSNGDASGVTNLSIQPKTQAD